MPTRRIFALTKSSVAALDRPVSYSTGAKNSPATKVARFKSTKTLGGYVHDPAKMRRALLPLNGKKETVAIEKQRFELEFRSDTLS